MPYFGAHMSIAGGIELAFDRLEKVGGEALQIFTANQRQWKARKITPAEAERFRVRRKEAGDIPVASHNSYLINLASAKAEVAEKSQVALAGELARCALLGIEFVVMHPGAHLGSGVEKGIERIATGIDRAIEDSGQSNQVEILLETTAGQGSSLGGSFLELAAIIRQSRHPERLGVCLDTCHIFAAGYDIATPQGYRETMAEFDREIGLERLKFIHLNDSKGETGSRLDRHQHIGQGRIGLAGFASLVNDLRLSAIPMVLETPKGEDLSFDRKNLATLKGLIGQ